MLQHTDRFFFKDFLAKNSVTTLEHPHTLLTWLQLICTCSVD